MTHTYATMEVPRAVYDAVKSRLIAADYDHAIHPHRNGECLDMHGIALVESAKTPERFFLDQDQDCRWYLVPVSLRGVWDAWCALDTQDEAAWEAPPGATMIDGPYTTTFIDPRTP